jgi:hypothetical protein
MKNFVYSILAVLALPMLAFGFQASGAGVKTATHDGGYNIPNPQFVKVSRSAKFRVRFEVFQGAAKFGLMLPDGNYFSELQTVLPGHPVSVELSAKEIAAWVPNLPRLFYMVSPQEGISNSIAKFTLESEDGGSRRVIMQYTHGDSLNTKMSGGQGLSLAFID